MLDGIGDDEPSKKEIKPINFYLKNLDKELQEQEVEFSKDQVKLEDADESTADNNHYSAFSGQRVEEKEGLAKVKKKLKKMTKAGEGLGKTKIKFLLSKGGDDVGEKH